MQQSISCILILVALIEQLYAESEVVHPSAEVTQLIYHSLLKCFVHQLPHSSCTIQLCCAQEQLAADSASLHGRVHGRAPAHATHRGMQHSAARDVPQLQQLVLSNPARYISQQQPVNMPSGQQQTAGLAPASLLATSSSHKPGLHDEQQAAAPMPDNTNMDDQDKRTKAHQQLIQPELVSRRKLVTYPLSNFIRNSSVTALMPSDFQTWCNSNPLCSIQSSISYVLSTYPTPATFLTKTTNWPTVLTSDRCARSYNGTYHDV